MANRYRSFRIVLAHLSVWLVYIFINNFLLFYTEFSASFFQSLSRLLFTYPLVAALFYVNAHFVADRFIPSRRYVLLILWSLLLVISYVSLRIGLYKTLFPLLGTPANYANYHIMFNEFTLDSLWIASQYLLFSYGYWFAYYQINLQREKRQLAANLAAVEKDRMLTEIAFLQAQINPHFLYNTFNFLYSEAFLVSPELADAILTLSAVMRSLTELGKQSYLPIRKVLELVENYLKLQRYRFGETLHFNLTIEGEHHSDCTYVPPLVFMTLIENIFKHGDLSEISKPAQVKFQLTGNSLTYRSNNKKIDTSVSSSLNVGMANLYNQLQLLYGDKFSMYKAEDSSTYNVELIILDTTINR